MPSGERVIGHNSVFMHDKDPKHAKSVLCPQHICGMACKNRRLIHSFGKTSNSDAHNCCLREYSLTNRKFGYHCCVHVKIAFVFGFLINRLNVL